MIKKAVILYAPAIHQGYINFLADNPYDLYVLDVSLVKEIPRLDRDIRALSANSARAAFESLDLVPNVSVLKKQDIAKLLATYTDFILPNEDVSHFFAEKYLDSHQTEFTDIFLRWDRQISLQENIVQADRVVSVLDFDKESMAKASKEAAKSPDWWRQVGALLYTQNGNDTLIAHNSPLPSHNYSLDTFGDPRSNFDAGESIELSKVIHAEANVIAQAAKAGISVDKSSIYVTTFPCPPCAKLIAVAGVEKVYYQQGYSLLDAEDILKARNVEIVLVKAD